MRVRETTSFVLPDDLRQLVPLDVLSSVLQELRFQSAAYRWFELGAPYRIGFAQAGLRGVHIVAQGSCELELEDGTITPLSTGDLVILPRGDNHVLRSAAAGRSAPTVSGLEFALRAEGGRIRAGGTGEESVIVCGAFTIGEADHPALRGLPTTIHVPAGDTTPWLAPFVEVLAHEAFHGGAGSDLVMARLSDALLTRALRHHSDTANHPGWLAGLRDRHIAPVLAAVHRDPARPWTVATLAREASLSRAAFAARFTACVGQPAMTYLSALRMQRAKTLLRDPHRTVAAIADQVGYQSDVAFAVAFKRECGQSPGRYRQAYAERNR